MILWSLDLSASAAPLAGADNVVGASELGVVVNRTHVVSGGPGGRNAYNWEFLYDSAQNNSGSSYGGEFYLGWQKDVGAAPTSGQSRFSRLIFRIPTGTNFRAINSANGSASQIIHKLWILADGGSTRTIVSVHGNVGSGTFNLHVGLNGGAEINLESLEVGEWYALQVETVLGTGTGALRAWLNTDVQGTPTAQATSLTINPALYDGVSLGFYNNRMLASDGVYEIDYAAFEYADTFDSAWYTNMGTGGGGGGTPTPPAPTNPPGQMMQPLMGYTSSVGSSSTGICLDHNHIGTAGFPGTTRAPWPLAGTFRNLVVSLSAVPGGTATRTLTLEVNGSNTAMVASFAAGDTTARYTASNITIAAGDVVRLVAASTNTPTTATITWSVEFWPTAAASSGYVSNLGTTQSGFLNPFTGETNASAAAVPGYIPCPGTITALFAANHYTALNSGDHLVFNIYKNGVKQDGTGGTVNTTLDLTNVAIDTAVSASFSLTVARGDYITIEMVATSYPSSWTGIALVFVADTDGYSILCGAGSNNPSAGSTYYAPLQAYVDNWSSGSGARLIAGVTPFNLRDLYLVVDTDPGAAPNSRTFTVLKNAADTAITGAVTTGVLTIDDDNVVAFVDEDWVGPMKHVPADTPTVTGDEFWALVIEVATLPTGLKVTQTVIEYISAYPASPGGGGSETGTNPTLGAIPSEVPLVFVELYIDGTWYVFGETYLNDATTWHHGPKLGKVISVSPIRYTLSKESGFEAVTTNISLWDGDRQLHNLMGDGSTALRNAFCTVYIVNDSVRRAEGVPKRIFAGLVSKYKTLGNFQIDITAKDVLGVKLANLNREPTIPPERLTLAEFPGMEEALDGTAIPICVGHLTDAAEAIPQGVVRPLLFGTINLQDVFGGVDQDADVWIISQGAVPMGGIQQVWYNEPASPTVRTVVPEASYGVDLIVPWKAGWLEGTGLATQYVDYNGRRYTPMFVDSTNPLAAAARDGRVLIAINMFGVDDVGDGSGQYLDSPSIVWQWLIVNFVFGLWQTGPYESLPEFPVPTPYSYIDTDTVESVHDYFMSRIATYGYRIGFVLGADGSFQTVFDVLTELCKGVWMDMGLNLDGQLVVSVRDATATAVMTFDAQTDILDDSYEVECDDSRYANRVEHQYAFYYVPPYAPAPTPAEGDPVPSKPIPDYTPYKSGVVITDDATAQTAVGGEVVPFKLENRVVRLDDVATDVTTRILEELTGPQDDGPHTSRFKTGLQGLGNASVSLRVGSVINVTHPQKFGSSTTDKIRITAMTIDPTNRTVDIEGDILTHSA